MQAEFGQTFFTWANMLPRRLVPKDVNLTSHCSLPCSLKLVFLSLGLGPYLHVAGGKHYYLAKACGRESGLTQLP